MFSANRPTERTKSRTRMTVPRSETTDRRRRRHLRDLCDEVLASYRVAAGKDLFSETDRADGRALFAQIAGSSVAR
jgi:hypothetical protein